MFKMLSSRYLFFDFKYLYVHTVLTKFKNHLWFIITKNYFYYFTDYKNLYVFILINGKKHLTLFGFGVQLYVKLTSLLCDIKNV